MTNGTNMKKKIFQAHRRKLQDFLDFSAATEFGSSCEWSTFLDDFFWSES